MKLQDTNSGMTIVSIQATHRIFTDKSKETTNKAVYFKNILARARERQKLLEGYTMEKPTEIQASSQSEPNLTKNESPKTQKFSSEVSSAENVRVEVQIEEHDDSAPLRPDAKHRLNRLGRLYAGGEDAGISSPIHRTEAAFCAEEEPKTGPKAKGLTRLAALARDINQWEDDLTPTHKASVKKSTKAPAPQPPASPLKQMESPKKAQSPRVVGGSPKKEVKWDKKVLDSLESQGFTRTDSSSRLVYNYAEAPKSPKSAQKENQSSGQKSKIADRAAIFESKPSSPIKQQKDPALLSVSERKALFERNKGAALVPKAAFAMAAPQPNKAALKSKLGKSVPAPKPPEMRAMTNENANEYQTGGIRNKVAALFEEKTTISQVQIENGVREQRQKEMDMLLNRFHRPETAENVDAIKEGEESDEESDTSVDDKTAMISGKEKPKVVEKRRSSGNKRCSKADSPKVAAVLSDVKRIKVTQKEGRLYPSLTDIESQTETETEIENQSPTPNNSFGAESDDVNTSFGRDILRAVCNKQSPQKRLNLSDSTDSSDLSSLLNDEDDYIDEALAYSGGPPPPKQGRHSPIECSSSFNYKNCQSDEFRSPMKKISPRQPSDEPIQVIDGDSVVPLTHTVSFYRKQQSQSNSNTPIRQIARAVIIENEPEESDNNCEEIQARIAELRLEISKQEMIISQTSQALNLCNSTPEFMGSTEQVEAEKVLLVATHRRQAASHELQRVKVENSLRPQSLSPSIPLEKGTLTISKIVLPLKQKYVTALAAAGGKGHHVVCLVKYGDQVLSTPLVSTVASSSKNPDLELTIPGTIQFKDVYSDFAITFEVYCLQAQEEILPHELKYHIHKKGVKLITPKKGNKDRLVRPIKESPAGPQAVRSPTFALMGITVFSIQAVNKRQWTLNNAPSMSPLEGTVEMSVSCELSLSVEHRGFLTMFEDVSGFGAWHRRWCLLKGATLSYWKYPDDERKTPPINTIDLRNCITKAVGVVARDICARLHTFLFEIERVAYASDRDTLVTIRNGDKTVIRHLLSADTKEERVEWCRQFNAALTALKMWPKH